MRVVNGCRREESNRPGDLFNAVHTLGIALDDCYQLGGKCVVEHDETGRRRFFGFGPGHEVDVVGTLHGARLHASAVFGGSPEEYVAALRTSLWPFVIGVVIGLFLMVASVIVAYMGFCVARGGRWSSAKPAPAGEP